MKLMYCELCSDLVVPNPRPRVYSRCRCGNHAVWWEDPSAGILRVYDARRVVTKRELPMDPDDATLGTYEYEGPPDGWKSTAWVVGIHNQWLTAPTAGRKTIDAVLAMTPDTYVFKRDESVAIKIRPGNSNDTAYDYLPAGWGG